MIQQQLTLFSYNLLTSPTVRNIVIFKQVPFEEQEESALMSKVTRFSRTLLQRWQLSLFEKVILVNSFMLIGEAMAGFWVTGHSLEAHHYIIDTSFIVLATLLTLFTNIILLRASFRPLFTLLTTIRAVSAGKTEARATVTASASEIGELAQAFNSMLDRLEAARHEQTMQILQAQEEERRRIALELHDETGQSLTALLIHTEVLKRSIASMPEETCQSLTQGLQRLEQLTQRTLDNIRVLAQQLRPSVLDDLGLLAAFRWLVEDSSQRLHLEVELAIEGREEVFHHLPSTYETTLFRIAQESLTNIARHAHTQHASIVLKEDQCSLSLQIQDWGCGYDLTEHRRSSGVIGMYERATLLKGNLAIHSHPGQGTTVQATLPMPVDHEEARIKGYKDGLRI